MDLYPDDAASGSDLWTLVGDLNRGRAQPIGPRNFGTCRGVRYGQLEPWLLSTAQLLPDLDEELARPSSALRTADLMLGKEP